MEKAPKADHGQACPNHPGRKVQGCCHACREWLCLECLQEGPLYYYCRKSRCSKKFQEEVRANGKKCPSCGEILKGDPEFCAACDFRLKPVAEDDREDLAVVARFGNAVEAHLARTALESHGIEAFVADEHLISIDPFYDLGLGGVRLQVKKSEEALAFKLLGRQAKGSMFVPPPWYAYPLLVFFLLSALLATWLRFWK